MCIKTGIQLIKYKTIKNPNRVNDVKFNEDDIIFLAQNFIISGVLWIQEVISTILSNQDLKQNEQFEYISTLINALFGFIIFFIFVVLRLILFKIKEVKTKTAHAQAVPMRCPNSPIQEEMIGKNLYASITPSSVRNSKIMLKNVRAPLIPQQFQTKCNEDEDNCE